MPDAPEYLERNSAYWSAQAHEYAPNGRENWAAEEPSWGVWSVPESQLHVLPGDLDGLDTIELGCGTGYVSAGLARRGARPVGIDPTENQLRTARRLQAEFGLEFPLITSGAESVPFPDESFDLAISEYGASLWADPYLWIPEAARLLRPGGRLIFLSNSPLAILCDSGAADATTEPQLFRPYFGMHRVEWPGEDCVEFHLPHGKTIELLRDSGFEIEELTEVQVPEGSTTRHQHIDLEWSRQWPCEEIWKARKR
jgi:SAM-dependent methyltransferase